MLRAWCPGIGHAAPRFSQGIAECPETNLAKEKVLAHVRLAERTQVLRGRDL